ncbi:hypothetical protein H0H93_006827 [Arthromyces matolae]|nr:hypothetical protein H0H93_006827 [Arthromyces matolae]
MTDAISSRDLITSDINLHGHQSSESVERRDSIFVGLAVRSPTGNPSPPPTLQELEDDAKTIPTIDTAPPLPTLPNLDSDTIRMIRRLEQLKAEDSSCRQRGQSFFKKAFDLIHDFLFSLGAQSVAQREHQPILVKQWITTAEHIQQAIDGASDNQTSKYPKEITEAALRLLAVAKNDSMENKKLTSEQVTSMVTTFTKDIESLEQERQAAKVKHDDCIVGRMNLNVQLWNHLTRGLRRDDPAYHRINRNPDLVKFAQSQLEKNPSPKVQAAAKSLLNAFGITVTVETNQELLVEEKSYIASDQAKKRKADDADGSIGGSTGGSSDRDAKQHKKE